MLIEWKCDNVLSKLCQVNYDIVKLLACCIRLCVYVYMLQAFVNKLFLQSWYCVLLYFPNVLWYYDGFCLMTVTVWRKRNKQKLSYKIKLFAQSASDTFHLNSGAKIMLKALTHKTHLCMENAITHRTPCSSPL